MKKYLWLLPLFLWAACGSNEEEPRDAFFTEDEWLKIRGFSPLPDLPPSKTNKYADDAKAAILGQKFFFDARFSGPLVSAENAGAGGNGPVGSRGKIACASCHQPDNFFVDKRSVPNNTSLGAGRTGRHTPGIVNAAYLEYFFWDGRADSLWMQATRPTLSGVEHNFTMLEIAHVIYDHYKSEYEAIFGTMPNVSDASRFPAAGSPATPEGNPATLGWSTMTTSDQDAVRRIVANFGKSIEAYERKLISKDARFDDYVAGSHNALNTSEKNGLKLFIGTAKCELCHKGPMMADNIFHNIGLKRGNGPHIPAYDYGGETAYQYVKADLFNGIGPYSDDKQAGQQRLDFLVQPRRSAFKSMPLRNISKTAPYFHDGSAATLRDVLNLYKRGGDPEGTFDGDLDPQMPTNIDNILTEQDLVDLEAFLRTLDGKPIDPSLMRAP